MGIIPLVDVAFNVYIFLIVIRVFLSWVKHNPYQPAIKFIYEITEPVLGLFRRIIPPIGMMDLSPIVVLFVLNFVRLLVLKILDAIF